MGAMDAAYRFHHYRLLPVQRQLLEGERPVKLGSRAFDMLLALVERRERVVDKHELMDLVWPRLVVEENNLQVQVLALRKLLGHGAISTIPGRGYRFTLPVRVDGEAAKPPDVSSAAPAATEPGRQGDLPPPPHLYGRDDDLVTLNGLIEQHGLVTVAGAGGIGKTVLARGVAQQQQARHGAGVWWVELAALSDPALVPNTVARALGLVLDGTKDPTQAVLEVLRGRAALLVLDNAEHLLDGVAGFVSALRDAATACRHSVDGAGLDDLHRAEAVAVNEAALEEVGHRCQTDVRMGADVAVCFGRQRHGTKVIEEHERPDGAPCGGG